MKLSAVGMARLLRSASALIVLGLIVEIISLLWFHPLAFVLFAFAGVALIALGILVYLASLVFAVPSAHGDEPSS
jgi:hypothetical protein